MTFRFARLTTTLACALAFTGLAAAQSAEMSVGHVLATASHYHAAATKFAEVVNQKSKGAIKASVFPGGQLGGEVKMLQSARTGTLDVVVTGEAPLEGFAKEYAVFSFPYLFSSVDQINGVLQGPIGRGMLDLLPKHNLVGLGFISALERNIFTNGKVVNTVADMKGLKIRVIQGPGYVKAYQALGAQPTPMAYTELYTALQNGAVDAAENSPDVFLQDRFIEVSKTYANLKIMYMPAVIVMSKAKYEALSPDMQKVVHEATAEAISFATAQYKKDYADAFTAMKKTGIKIIEPDLKPFMQVGRSVHAELLGEFPMAKPWYDKIVAATK